MSNRQWKRFQFPNSAGHELAGMLYTAGKRDTPTLIVCHGFTGSKEGDGNALQMAEYFAGANFDTLLFDFAGNGESGGSFEDLTLSRQIDDLNCAVDRCKEEGAGPIVTMGRSFGGTTVICHAARDHRVAGVCTWAAASNLVELFTEFVDEDPDNPEKVVLEGEEGFLTLKKTFFTDLKQYDVPQLASLISPRPLTVIHGTRDEVVSPRDAEAVFHAAGNPKELFFIDGGDHQFEHQRLEVWDISYRWLQKFS